MNRIVRLFKFLLAFALLQLLCVTLMVLVFGNFIAHPADTVRTHQQYHEAYVDFMLRYAPPMAAITYFLAALYGYGLRWRNYISNGLSAVAIYYLLTTPAGIRAQHNYYDGRAVASPTPETSIAPTPSSSIAPTPPPHYIYLLKEPVSVPNSFGVVGIPANAEVEILTQSGTTDHVRARGVEFDVPSDQILRVQH